MGEPTANRFTSDRPSVASPAVGCRSRLCRRSSAWVAGTAGSYKRGRAGPRSAGARPCASHPQGAPGRADLPDSDRTKQSVRHSDWTQIGPVPTARTEPGRPGRRATGRAIRLPPELQRAKRVGFETEGRQPLEHVRRGDRGPVGEVDDNVRGGEDELHGKSVRVSRLMSRPTGRARMGGRPSAFAVLRWDWLTSPSPDSYWPTTECLAPIVSQARRTERGIVEPG